MNDYKPKDPSIKLMRNNLNSNFDFRKPLNEPLPAEWITIEENFVFFLIVNLPLLTSDFITVSNSTFNDGVMHLIFIREGISKMQLLQLMSSTENGDVLDHPSVEYVRIKGFRLEPLGLANHPNCESDNDGVIMIDGERVPYGTIQGEILPSIANVLAFNKTQIE